MRGPVESLLLAALAGLLLSCDDGGSSETDASDRDQDGVPDELDAFPDDPSEWADSDGDGVGDNGDAFPSDPGETTDSDGDGVGDNGDAFPSDPGETADSDGDGVGDNGDAFPSDPGETTDTDADGLGDNSDPTPAGTTENRLNGTFSGGLATVVEMSALDGGAPYDTDLTVGCDYRWGPQGTLCDEAPFTHSPDVSGKLYRESGATWTVTNPGAGLLVIDAGQVIDFNEARVFQMFSDGKTTHVRLFVHAERGATPPAANDAGWTAITALEPVGPGQDDDWHDTVDAHMVSQPTTIEVDAVITRYVMVEARNDDSLGYDGYIELRALKLFSVPRSQ